MSRSFKKTPVVKDGHSGKFGKKVANRKVRYYKGDISNGKTYQKIYESWDIHDFVSFYPLSKRHRDHESEQNAILNNGVRDYRKQRPLTLSVNEWAKCYKRK